MNVLNQRALLLIGLLSASLLGAQQRKPDVQLDGTITGQDNQTYKLLPFQVPAGVSRITVDFGYTGKQDRTTLDLGIYDPRGFRGWSGGNKSHFTISETDATPSYLPGEIYPGTWKLIIGIPNIRRQSRAEYRASIYFARTLEQRLTDSEFNAPRDGPGWYRGDLHMHTGSSDGSCASKLGNKVPCPLFKTLEIATERKLDFIAVTDHNDVSHFQQLRELAPYFDNLLLLHGREITTFHGHANVFGTDAPIDFRVGTKELPDVNALLHEVKDSGGLISINHPNAPTGETCMGCGWDPKPEADLHMVQAVEAVNSGDSGTPYSGITFWTQALNRGFRLTGIGGSDNHNPDLPGGERGAIGHPTTVVYAEKLSEREILAGIRAGHVFIDVQGPSDRLLEFSAASGTSSARMGDNLNTSSGAKIEYSLHVGHAKDDSIEIIQDGEKLNPLASPQLTSDDETRKFELPSDGRRHWVRATILDPTGKTVLVGNPVYINFCCSQTEQPSAQSLPGERVLMDAHNCYPYDGKWADRISRALSAGTPLAIEQDLALYHDPKTHSAKVVVSHKAEVDGTEPTLESYFFETIRPIVEKALREGKRGNWPLITLNLDLKSEDPELVQGARDVLFKYRDWLTTAARGNSIYDVQPLHPGPVLVLTGEQDVQQKYFFDDLKPGDKVLAFGAVHDGVQNPSASPEAILTEPVNDYRRWANFSWQVIESAGQPNAGEWTQEKENRLRALIARAHGLGYWIRFYTLDGGTPEEFKQNGWFDGYNFGSSQSAIRRWYAAIQDGADFIASDEYEGLARMVKTETGSRQAARAKQSKQYSN